MLQGITDDMRNGKTGLLILTVLAAMFFLFVAILFGSSTKRQGIIDRKADLEAKLDSIMATDVSVYWIGEVPAELEYLSPVIIRVSPEKASGKTLPVKGPSFEFTEYNELGQVISHDVPLEQSQYMVIVVSGSPVLSDEGSEALRNAVAQNGVPVIAIGNDAAELLGNVLYYRRFKSGEGSSLYYCLGKGYKENPLSVDTVKNGGMELAEATADLISAAMTDFGGEITTPSPEGSISSGDQNYFSESFTDQKPTV